MRLKILPAAAEGSESKGSCTGPSLNLSAEKLPTATPSAFGQELASNSYFATRHSVSGLAALAARLADPTGLFNEEPNQDSLVPYSPLNGEDDIDIDLGIVLALLGRELLASERCQHNADIVLE